MYVYIYTYIYIYVSSLDGCMYIYIIYLHCMYVCKYIYGIYFYYSFEFLCLYIFKENETGGTYGKYRAEERRKQGYGGETLLGFQNTRNT